MGNRWEVDRWVVGGREVRLGQGKIFSIGGGILGETR